MCKVTLCYVQYFLSSRAIFYWCPPSTPTRRTEEQQQQDQPQQPYYSILSWTICQKRNIQYHAHFTPSYRSIFGSLVNLRTRFLFRKPRSFPKSLFKKYRIWVPKIGIRLRRTSELMIVKPLRFSYLRSSTNQFSYLVDAQRNVQ